MPIARVVHWNNGQVMTFDENGEQIPEYQGTWKEIKDKILSDAPTSTVFGTGEWNKWVIPITRREFSRNPERRAYNKRHKNSRPRLIHLIIPIVAGKPQLSQALKELAILADEQELMLGNGSMIGAQLSAIAYELEDKEKAD